jgi:hypothetical protein
MRMNIKTYTNGEKGLRYLVSVFHFAPVVGWRATMKISLDVHWRISLAMQYILFQISLEILLNK